MTRSRGPLATFIAAALVFGCSSGGTPGRESVPIVPVVAPDVPVTPADLQSRPAHNSPGLSVDPTDARFVAAASRLDAPAFGCSLNVSGDGGRSWIGAQPVSELPAGAEKCYAPQVAFDPEGTLYYLYVGLHTRGNTPMGVFLTTSADRARSFSPPRQVLGPNAFGVRLLTDPNAGENGRLDLVWIQASADPTGPGFPPGPNPIMASHSDDGGATFSTPVMVSDPALRHVTAPSIALGPDSIVHVLYYDLGADARDYQGLEGPTWEGDWSLLLASSSDGGASFGPSTIVEPAVVPPERVMLVLTMPPASLAVDTSGRLYVSWHDARNDDWDVFVRTSDSGGASWSEPVRANDDAVSNGRHQYLPMLAAAPNGRIDLVYYDRRRDPENIMNDVSLTWSTNEAAAFAPAVRLNREAFDSRGGARYPHAAARGLVEFGSRLGLIAQEGRALAAWTDTRNAFGGISELVARPDQDIFATEVDFESAPENDE